MSSRESDHVHEREKSPFHFGWMKRSTLLYMHVIDEGRGEFRTATGAGDECREVPHQAGTTDASPFVSSGGLTFACPVSLC